MSLSKVPLDFTGCQNNFDTDMSAAKGEFMTEHERLLDLERRLKDTLAFQVKDDEGVRR